MYLSRGRRDNTNLCALGKPEDMLRILNVEWLGFDVWIVAVERGSMPSSTVKSVEYIYHSTDKEIELSGLPVRTSFFGKEHSIAGWVVSDFRKKLVLTFLISNLFLLFDGLTLKDETTAFLRNIRNRSFTRRHIPELLNSPLHRCENLKSNCEILKGF
jgi:hypothetical protein